jgi:hypothetical protein
VPRVRMFLPLVGVVALTGCGPTASLSVSMSQYPTNLVVGGKESAAATAPAPAVQPSQQVTILLPSPAPTAPPTPPAPPVPPPVTVVYQPPPIGDCGTSAYTAAANAVSQDAQYPPVPATYKYRIKGTFDSDGERGNFPAQDTRTVSNVQTRVPSAQKNGPEYTFDVTETRAAGRTTTYTFHIIPITAFSGPITYLNHQGVSQNDPAGIYLSKVQSNDPASLFGGIGPTGNPTGGFTFIPSPEIKLVQFAIFPNQTWTSQGSDAGSQSSFNFTGTTVQTDYVDACGSVLEAWQVHMKGSLSSVNHRSGYADLTWDLGPQYGGFILSEHTIFSGSSESGRLRDFMDETATISQKAISPQPNGGI